MQKIFSAIVSVFSLFLSVSCDADRLNVDDSCRFEQVKINQLIKDGITQFSHIRVEKLFDFENTTSNSVQSIAIFGHELFSFHDTNDVIDVYDLNQLQLKQSIILNPSSSTHCNNASFGHLSESSEDKYPLLYLMERGSLHRMLVFRLTDIDGKLNAEKIQTIDLGTDTTAVAYLDSDAEKLFVHYYVKGKPSVRYLSRFSVPSIEHVSYRIPINDAEYTITMDRSEMQDAVIYKGILFMLQGYSNSGQLHYYHLDQQKDYCLMELPEFGLYAEPEGIAVYDDSLILSFYNRTVFKITFYRKVSISPNDSSSNIVDIDNIQPL